METHKSIYTRLLIGVVNGFAVIAGLSVLVMMLLMVAESALGFFRRPIVGAYDLVKVAGAVAVTAALPYTTAVKGHVAIEFLLHRLNRTSRKIMEAVVRLMVIFLCGFSAWQSWLYGNSLKTNGQVSQTLQMPVFWVMWLIAVTFGVMVLVLIYQLLNPGREMIKP